MPELPVEMLRKWPDLWSSFCWCGHAPHQDSNLWGGVEVTGPSHSCISHVWTVNTRCLVSIWNASCCHGSVERCTLTCLLSDLVAGSEAAELTWDLSGPTQIIFE